MKELEQKILKHSYENKLSHIGSCLTALPIIEKIYSIKKPDEKFVLSSGHAHLAHAVVMSQETGKPIGEFMKAGIHCDKENGCDVSTGSLGQGVAISMGMALADRQRDVYVLLSDGEMREGVVFECLQIAREQKLYNWKPYINCNGWGGYHKVDVDQLEKQVKSFGFPVEIRRTNSDFGDVKGLDAHYKIITDENYTKTIRQFEIGQSKRNKTTQFAG